MSQIFFSTHKQRLKEFNDSNRQLAHYTSAETAIKILKSKALWLRNTGVMNDSSEVIHGANLLDKALGRDSGAKLLKAIDECFDGISVELKQKINNWLPLILGDTFIASFSEHPVTPNEAEFGRLSMWRAYGHPNGVAIILNPDAVFQDYGNVGAYISSVAYMDESEVDAAFLDAANKIQNDKRTLLSLGREEALESIFKALRYAAICLKHPVFREELEWRLVASTTLYTGNLVTQEIESIGGIPQLILKLNFNKDSPLNIEDLIREVLVGPCAYPEIIVRALAEALSSAGFKEPYSMIRQTKIPLRPNQR